MIPKMTACLEAVEGGVSDGGDHRRPRPALDPARDLHPGSGIGTEVVGPSIATTVKAVK